MCENLDCCLQLALDFRITDSQVERTLAQEEEWEMLSLLDAEARSRAVLEEQVKQQQEAKRAKDQDSALWIQGLQAEQAQAQDPSDYRHRTEIFVLQHIRNRLATHGCPLARRARTS